VLSAGSFFTNDSQTYQNGPLGMLGSIIDIALSTHYTEHGSNHDIANKIIT
jgi:hypothetical protein